MKRVESFQVDHNLLATGMFIARLYGGLATYDVRMTMPNSGDLLDMDAVHSMEHLFAAYVRNSGYADSVVYMGPMGCRTGFYFIVHSSMTHQDALDLMRDAMRFIAEYSEPDVPNRNQVECANHAGHNLPLARSIAARMAQVLERWTVEQMTYPA